MRHIDGLDFPEEALVLRSQTPSWCSRQPWWVVLLVHTRYLVNGQVPRDHHCADPAAALITFVRGLGRCVRAACTEALAAAGVLRNTT